MLRVSLIRVQLFLSYAVTFLYCTRFKGKAGIGDFHAGKQGRSKRDFAKWKQLSFKGVAFDHNPMKVKVAEVVADRPYVNVVITADGSLNLTRDDDNGVGHPDGAENAGAQKGTDLEVPVNIGLVRIKNGSAFFADRSLTPNFATGIESLNGTIKGLSSNRNARAAIDLHGQVDRHAPVDISGEINPFSTAAYTDIKMQFKNVSLTSLTPYSGKFAGYEIEKGKLSMDVRYQLENRKLTAENKVVLDRLTLGDKVDSSDATSLPVGLAIALLTDANGEIDLNLPISGSLDGPEFSIWGLVGDALLNLITKIVTSPFALIGGLAGGGEELSYVAFEPGSAVLTEVERKKLDQVGAALKERPQLQLEINGIYDPQLDRMALAEKDVLEQIKRELGDEKNPAVKNKIPLDNEDYRNELEDMHEDAFEDQPAILDADEALKEANPDQWIETVKQRLLEKQSIELFRLRMLAQQRAKNIQTYMTKEGGLADRRVFLLDVDPQSEGREGGVKTTLSLTAS